MLHHLLDLGADVEGFAGVAVAVAGDQRLGFDLSEAVQRPLHAEVRRTGGPNAAQDGGGEHGDHRLNAVGQPAGHPVAAADAQGLEVPG